MLGDPVAHSLSPAINGAAFDELGLDAEYVAIQADVDVLDEALRRLRDGELSGFNVTMPLKGEAARMVDALGPDTGSGQSVNTVAYESGTVTGYSTDITALRSMLDERWPDTGSLYVLGSGGAAWAAADASSGRVVYVGARDPDKAARLVDVHPDASVVPWGVPVAGAVVVNATPLGMRGEGLPEGIIDSSAGLIDLPYGPVPTPATARAVWLGLPLVDGVEFLVAQAADALRIWIGGDPPISNMLRAARNA